MGIVLLITAVYHRCCLCRSLVNTACITTTKNQRKHWLCLMWKSMKNRLM